MVRVSNSALAQHLNARINRELECAVFELREFANAASCALGEHHHGDFHLEFALAFA